MKRLLHLLWIDPALVLFADGIMALEE